MILSFASMPFELNLWALNKWLSDSKRLLLPRVEQDGLQIYKVTSWKQLYISHMNIQEPNPFQCEKVSLDQINYILVPAICFDANFHRLGYGKGYYDRFLPNVPKAKKWGVGFKEQLIPALPSEQHDYQLDSVFLF
jgi:5-formyltetrahydrofolate cyclo-ligase